MSEPSPSWQGFGSAASAGPTGSISVASSKLSLTIDTAATSTPRGSSASAAIGRPAPGDRRRRGLVGSRHARSCGRSVCHRCSLHRPARFAPTGRHEVRRSSGPLETGHLA